VRPLLTLALLVSLGAPAPVRAESGERHKPVRKGTAGFRETLALRINAGPGPACMSDAMPVRDDPAGEDGAFVGRDGRLYVWDASHRNVKIVSFPAAAPPAIALTREWKTGPEPVRMTSGDADSAGVLYLAGALAQGDALLRCYAWTPGAALWQEFELPRYGGYADAGGLELRAGARVHVLADGGVVLVPASVPRPERGLRIGAHGRFAALESLAVVETPELAGVAADVRGRRLLPAGVNEIVLADSAGHPLASMAREPKVAWKRLVAPPELLEPWGTLLTLHATTRGLAIHRLTPEIPDVGPPQLVPPADTTRVAAAADSAHTRARAKKKASRTRRNSSITE
jgi:hypothetical protein